MDKQKKLKEIFENDPLGLLNIKPASTPAKNEDERLVASFQEINEFYKTHNREPELGGEILEYMLYCRLKGLREDESKSIALEAEDKYGLLKVEKKEINSLDDILKDDTLGILDSNVEDIFDLKHVPKETTMPDYVASRKPCKDFQSFEHLLKQCQTDLTEGKRRLHPFKNEQQIEKGYFFVLKGVLLYVAEVGEKKPDENGKVNARLRCIFENGTESDMLLRSLAAELYKNGRRVTEHEDKLLNDIKGISQDDKEVGFIYALKSKSKDDKLLTIRHLYKIGYSKISVEERIRDAESDPTFLMAPVSVVAVFQCYNMNPQKLEQLLHNFFGNSCLNIDVFDKNGSRHIPREWFIAPLSVIEDAIQFIISGEIIDYMYDPIRQEIINRNTINEQLI
ncbi:MAG: hypothetical protein A2Y10_15730 [Planctomycetes bacterium GWF2_41_51]|nr:MAG: hypothetical protein A2Y10_15730 [Planctomycetes bacterium GWF2_41_51]HBG27618.1 hypothetical protein [Phycisphaerales bacterium]